MRAWCYCSTIKYCLPSSSFFLFFFFLSSQYSQATFNNNIRELATTSIHFVDKAWADTKFILSRGSSFSHRSRSNHPTAIIMTRNRDGYSNGHDRGYGVDRVGDRYGGKSFI